MQWFEALVEVRRHKIERVRGERHCVGEVSNHDQTVHKTKKDKTNPSLFFYHRSAHRRLTIFTARNKIKRTHSQPNRIPATIKAAMAKQHQQHLSTVLSLLLVFAGAVSAMLANPEAFQHTQPNGQVIELKMKGGPAKHWITDMNDYTVILNRDGAYYYAQDNGRGGLDATKDLVQTNGNGPSAMGPFTTYGYHAFPKKDLHPTHTKCKPNLFCADVREHETLASVLASHKHNTKNGNRKLRGLVPPKTGHELCSALSTVRRSLEQKTAPTGGKLRNLVLMMLWSDHEERPLPTKEEVEILMSHEGAHQLAPTGSVRDVFLENSHGKLDLESVVIDWIPMNNSELYYSSGESGLTTRFHEAIHYALQYVDTNNMVDFDYFDADNNGQIDAITFLHSGVGAEFTGGDDRYGRGIQDRIWSHKWALQEAFVSKSGVHVQPYHVSSVVWGRSGAAIGRIGVIAHEMGHFLGMPDLYDRDRTGFGLGAWGLMSIAWGFDGSQQYPSHSSAWVKQELGWIDVHTPQQGVNLIEYSGNQNPTHPQIYRIDEGFPEGEYLLIENRQPHGLNLQIPQGGLLIYHIDEKAELYLEGHPGQDGWPENGNHYSISLAQADGLYDLELQGNWGDSGDVFHGAGVNFLTPCHEGESCRYPNTDSYQNGTITRTNVEITNISLSDSVMSFHYQVIGSLTSTSPTISPSALPTAIIENGLTSGAVPAAFKGGGMALFKFTPLVLGMAITLTIMVVSAML